MKTIWKFTLQPQCELEMPKGAQILSVREQGEDICLWALVDPAAEKVTRKFCGFGTGHDVPDGDMRFVGTAHLYGGSMVFHVFEVLGQVGKTLGEMIVEDTKELAAKTMSAGTVH